jgi:hypothetical protein
MCAARVAVRLLPRRNVDDRLGELVGSPGRLGVIGTPLEGVGRVLGATPRVHHFVTNVAIDRIFIAGGGAIDRRFIHRAAMRACEVSIILFYAMNGKSTRRRK